MRGGWNRKHRKVSETRDIGRRENRRGEWWVGSHANVSEYRRRESLDSSKTCSKAFPFSQLQTSGSSEGDDHFDTGSRSPYLEGVMKPEASVSREQRAEEKAASRRRDAERMRQGQDPVVLQRENSIFPADFFAGARVLNRKQSLGRWWRGVANSATTSNSCGNSERQEQRISWRADKRSISGPNTSVPEERRWRWPLSVLLPRRIAISG